MPRLLARSDVLVVLDLDRRGHLVGELISLIDELSERGIGFHALNSPMDTTKPAGPAFQQTQAALAELEGNVIRQRVRESIIAAGARGRKGGRPRIMTQEKLRYAQSLMPHPTRSNSEICRGLGDHPSSTLYYTSVPTERSRVRPAAPCRMRWHPGRSPSRRHGGATPTTHRDPRGAETAGMLALLPSDAVWATTPVDDAQAIEPADFDLDAFARYGRIRILT